MVRMYVRHSVENYDVWRKAYDAFDAERRSMGVTGDGVFQALDDPNDITLFHDFATPEQANAFVSSDRLKETMKGAGVTGNPDIWFVTEAG